MGGSVCFFDHTLATLGRGSLYSSPSFFFLQVVQVGRLIILIGDELQAVSE